MQIANFEAILFQKTKIIERFWTRWQLWPKNVTNQILQTLYYLISILASCNHTIQSYGSYTYFAGFLAHGMKIIPQHFVEYRNADSVDATAFLNKNPLENPLPKLYFFDNLKLSYLG